MFQMCVCVKLHTTKCTHMCHNSAFSGTACMKNNLHIVQNLCSRILISHSGMNLTKLNKESTQQGVK